MTDDQQNTSATPQPTSTPAGDDKNPLDVLEDILKEAKAKGAAKNTGPTPEEIAAQEEAEALKQAQQMQAEHRVQDQQEILVQISELDTIKDTPEYQAKVQQEQAAKDEKAEEQQSQDGFQIYQVGHKKI